ncbi:MAG: ClpXP protease specificity-enhancing factor SspB [Paracoccaceae bacterium]|jgi:hypothetical protein|nr:ClpXP protease specificity-enhancing factor SspB [Paracoccaceae bacterium]
MPRKIDYGKLMHRAMRGLIQDVLADVAEHGLPGEHHFFITFDTGHPDVAMADWLHDRYPEEMTIVIQHWFDALVVRDDDFSITLNFGDNPEPLVVPYDSIRTFVDPSVEFGLRFESHEAEDDEDDAPMVEDAEPEEESEATRGDAEVVRLDSFRK